MIDAFADLFLGEFAQLSPNDMFSKTDMCG